MSADRPAGRRPQVRFGFLCVLAYVALSWTVRSDLRLGTQIASLIYPFDTFSMYARLPGDEMGHVMVRDAGGDVHRVTAFGSFDCQRPVSGPDARCSERNRIQYLHEKLVRHVENHPGRGGEPADLILRSWRLRPGAAVERLPDCVISRCTVAP